jgi:lipooligosaccharide transport system ATP-binding protein
VEAVGDRVIIYTSDGEAEADRLTRNGIHPEATIVRRATLEDVFLILTGRSLEE